MRVGKVSRETTIPPDRCPSMRFIGAMVIALFYVRMAFAGAVYTWLPESPDGCCRGTLELSDEAFRAGEAIWQPGNPPDSAPMLRFDFEGQFRVPHGSETRTLPLIINFAPGPAGDPCCAWDIHIATRGKELVGRLRITTENDDIIMSGDDGSWQVDLAGSDRVVSGTICANSPAFPPCPGGRGRWVLTTPSQQAQAAE